MVSDVDLVAALARGEEWAAECLVDRVQPVLDKTLRRLLRTTGPDFDDLMQSAFERIIRTLTERPLAFSYNLAGWSSVVATRVALDSFRRRGLERRLFLGLEDAEVPRHDGLERQLDARVQIKWLSQALGKLPRKHAEALLLHDVLGHDLAEIAELTDSTVAAAQSRLVRGRKHLLARLAKRGWS